VTDRERFLACVLGEPVDRPPYWLRWGPWGTTLERWKREGADFGLLGEPRLLFEPETPPVPVPGFFGPYPAFEEKTLEETGDYRVFVDPWGVTRRAFKHRESMPEFIDFPVKTRCDWEQYKEERLNPDDGGRLEGPWRDALAVWPELGFPIQMGEFPDVGLYGGLRWLLGDEECLVAFCTDPDWVHEIMDHLTSLYLTVFDKMVRLVRIDVIHLWEDLCGRNGPLISPRQWEEFMGPCYRRIARFAREHDIRVFSVDTDGQPDLIIPPMRAAGVNFLWPLEVAAGCDVNAMRAKYPGLAMMGGIDKRALAQGPEAIDAELERIRPAVAAGRYIPDLDHSVPDDVSWANFCYYAEALKRLVGAG